MRRPSQNRLFNTAEPVGLADVLANGLPLAEALVTSDTENLSILHSGMPVRNPTELISLPQMVETLEALRSEADVVIIDAPACAAMADALLIAPHVDCIFHVIGVGMVDEQLMAQTIAALNAAAPKTMVFFVNRTPKPSRGKSYSSYYSYQYTYSGAGASNGAGPSPLPLPAAEDATTSKGAASGNRES
jgi:Mrp family chromosome partitioning ATPase